ncbi:MAG: S9 family peptidase [Bacteroidia bacterium]|nr:S9 family peptidase [Bacteroidia bacterium]
MRKNFILLLFIAFASVLSAQQNKQFTLDELIPGGKDFYTYYSRISEQFQWHGDNLMQINGDSVFVINNLSAPQKRTFQFRYADVKENVNRISFAENTDNLIRFYTRNGIGTYNTNTKQETAFFSYPEGSDNRQLSPNNSFLAYTKANNLFIADKNGNETAISNEKNKGIVYGQSVHRSEFGINSGIFWSPDGEKMAFYRMDETMVTDYPIVDISTRIATDKSIKYPMAGERSHEVTIGIYDSKTGKTVYLKTGEPKDKFLTNIAWSPDEKSIYVAELNREQNHMILNRYNAVSGELEKTLFEESHPKYVEPQHPVSFVKNKSTQFVWQSNRDGYNHLYLYDVSGKLLKQLTKGEWEVTDVIGFDEKGQNLFFASTNPTPTDRHIYSVNLKNGKTQRHTSSEGVHSAMVSASGRYLIDRYSAHNNPGKIDLIDTRNGKTITLASAQNPFTDINMPSVELGTIKAADNKTALYYRIIKPANFDTSKKHPVAIYVYGGPHSQMVQNRWRYGSGGWETYMAQKGYVVFVIDNRGTSYRGRDFENVTHRQLGVEEMKDQMRGVEFLQSLPYVDASRMGIHGWSYGGFMTISMLLNHPDVFKVGVAGGPVTDWKYYEVMYGERYMDTPQENPDGYNNSSLLNKADKLKSRLLIILGDEDPVVVMQHSLQFLKASITAGTHPDFFVYPGHEHNMMGPDRVHLHEHITRYFDDNIKKTYNSTIAGFRRVNSDINASISFSDRRIVQSPRSWSR